MIQLNSLIENQYNKSELFEEILNRLIEMGVNLNDVSRADISGVDEFHVRGAEVSKELASEIDLNNQKVLDLGCGLGGPARMLADEYNCHVTGIDLSREYIRTARNLSELVGLMDKTEFHQADALVLPFEDATFDVVWTQHVQMNINNKLKLYSEIKRVLTDNGTLIYYDIFKSENKEEIKYPVPWANSSILSFLAATAEVDNILTDLSFAKIATRDQTDEGIEFFRNLLEKLRTQGPPKLGLNVLMGDSTKEKLVNLLKGLEDKKLVLQSGIYKK